MPNVEVLSDRSNRRHLTNLLMVFVGAFGCAGGATAPVSHPAPLPATVLVAPIIVPTSMIPNTLDGVSAFLTQYCASCHLGGKDKGGVAFDDLLAAPTAAVHRETWEEIVAAVAANEMPPEASAQPRPDDRDILVAWADTSVLRLQCDTVDPGFVIAHRLNRAEYRNTVRDLFGVDTDVSKALPPDSSGEGFDNMAAALTLSPILLERYLDAADRVLDAVLFDPQSKYDVQLRLPADQAEPGYSAVLLGKGRVIVKAPDGLSVSTNLPFAATFKFRVKAQPSYDTMMSTWMANQKVKPDAGKVVPYRDFKMPVLRFLVDDEQQSLVSGMSRRMQDYTAFLRVPAGRHRIRAVVDGADRESSKAIEKGPRAQILFASVELTGPDKIPKEPGDAHRALIPDEPGVGNRSLVATTILTRFGERAFRRPVDAATLDSLVQVAESTWKDGGSFVEGVREGLRAILVSPRFLFRTDSVVAATGGPSAIDSYSLASRLSYFLWSTFPDEQLRRKAASGQLRTDLGGEVKRMLADDRARALVENFGGQWLQFRKMDDVAPEPHLFKTFSPDMRAAFRTETAMLFESIMREDRSVLEFLTADYTFVNELLASHYGMLGIQGPEFRRVSLEGLPRRGVLTHASTLTITSRSTRTSPVMRGKWVLETLLNTPPPPAPPDVPALPGDDDNANRFSAIGTLRQRLSVHRENPLCASCHARMDPLGFGLENFDAIGGYRELDNKVPVDASGVLVTGETFNGPIELARILSERKRDLFVRAFTSKLLTYALGRELSSGDRCAVEAIKARAARNNFRFSAFVEGIVESIPFIYMNKTGTKSLLLVSDQEK
jgi:mono/diheme cytochrome c family protein